MAKEITISEETIKKMRDTYWSNKEELTDIEARHENNMLEPDISPDETFEQGYNNAIEYMFKLMNISLDYPDETFENQKNALKEKLYDADMATIQDFLGYPLTLKESPENIKRRIDEEIEIISEERMNKFCSTHSMRIY